MRIVLVFCRFHSCFHVFIFHMLFMTLIMSFFSFFIFIFIFHFSNSTDRSLLFVCVCVCVCWRHQIILTLSFQLISSIIRSWSSMYNYTEPFIDSFSFLDLFFFFFFFLSSFLLFFGVVPGEVNFHIFNFQSYKDTTQILYGNTRRIAIMRV